MTTTKGHDRLIEIECAKLARDVYPPTKEMRRKGDLRPHCINESRYDSVLFVEVENIAVAIVIKDRTQYVVFPGTQGFEDICDDLNVDKQYQEEFGFVHAGFLEGFNLIYREVAKRVAAGVDIQVAGHSQGGAIGLLYCVRMARYEPHVTITGRSYGQPRVGGKSFNKIVDEINNMHLHWKFRQWINNQDIVHQMPHANWKQAWRIYKGKGQLTDELIYSHPESITKMWFDKKRIDRLFDEKPFGWKPSKADHEMAIYANKIECLYSA